MKISPVVAELFHADGRTYMTKLIVASRNFSNAPKKITHVDVLLKQCETKPSHFSFAARYFTRRYPFHRPSILKCLLYTMASTLSNQGASPPSIRTTLGLMTSQCLPFLDPLKMGESVPIGAAKPLLHVASEALVHEQ